MRTYIFTPVERKAIENFLAGKIRVSDPSIRMILTRVRTFKDLVADVALYEKLSLRLRESPKASST
jgi:hypothetical protein